MPPIQVVSKAWLAREIGVSPATLGWHMKRGKGIPNTLDDVDSWKTYFASVGRDQSAPGAELHDKIARQKLAILKEVRKDKRRHNRIEDKEIFESGAVIQFVTRLVSIFFGELERIRQEYPTTLKGKNEIEILTECKKQEEHIIATIKSKLEEGVK
jgi:hypothetical protein